MSPGITSSGTCEKSFGITLAAYISPWRVQRTEAGNLRLALLEHRPNRSDEKLMSSEARTPDPLDLVGAFRFCPSCGNPVLARDDHGSTPAMRMEARTLEAVEEICCSKCFLPWKSCPCGIKH